MTNSDQPEDQPPVMQDWAAQSRAHEARKQSIRPENRVALFEALEQHGVMIVTVTFDGYGDSGQIEDVSVTAGAPLDLAAIEIEQKQALWNKESIETVTITLRDSIEGTAYALLDDTHYGWCNNDGGSGQFVFDVAACTITLDFDERYVTTESYHHEF